LEGLFELDGLTDGEFEDEALGELLELGDKDGEFEDELLDD
jgi:hypothetical protein